MDNSIKTNIKHFFQQQAEIYPDEYYFENIQKIISNTAKNKQSNNSPESLSEPLIGIGKQNSDFIFVSDKAFNFETSKILSKEANNLFEKILNAIDLNIDDIYLTHLHTIDGHYEYIFNDQINIIKPQLIICFGSDVGKKLIKTEKSVSDIHGKIFKYHGYDTLVTYHPDAILKNNNLKRMVWEDFKKIKTFRR